MSVTLNINITRSSVYQEVDKITGYTGKKDSVDGSTYELIATVAENTEILGRYFDEACASVSDVVKRYMVSAPMVDSTGYAATLSMPSNWDSSLVASVNESVNTYIISYICCKWMRMVKSTEEEKYAGDAAGRMLELRSKLSHTKKPSRGSYIN